MKTLLTALALSLFAALSAGCVGTETDSDGSEEDVDVDEATLVDGTVPQPMMGGVVMDRPAVEALCGTHQICTIDLNGKLTCRQTPYHCD